MSRRGLNLYLDATYGGGPAMRRMKGDLQGAKKTLDATAVANRRFSRSLGGSTWRRQVQQAGMQISDFSVQVAGGQSAMLAFTQNAPQFLQNFGAMGGVIAAAVTILGTFAFMALRASDGVGDMGAALGVLRAPLEAVRASLAGMVDSFVTVANIAVNNIDTLIISAGVAATFFTVKWVAAMAMAGGATRGLIATLVALRGVMITLGFPALIIAVGYLIERFLTLKQITGSWGESFAAMGRVVKEVLLGIGDIARGLFNIMAGVASGIAGSFVRAFAYIASNWDMLVNGMASAWNALAGSGLGEQLGLGELGKSDVGGTVGSFADKLFDDAYESLTRGGNLLRDAGKGVAAEIANLRKILSAEDKIDVRDLLKPKSGDADDAAGGAAKRAAAKAKKVTAEIGDAFKTMQQAISSSMMSSFKGLIAGTKSLGDAVNGILGSIRDQMAELLLSPAISRVSGMLAGGISSLFGGSAGPLAGNKLFDIAGSFYGGGQTRSGPRAGGIDGRGGQISVLHPDETITDNRRGAAGGGRAAVVNNIKVVAPPGSEVREERQSNDSGGQDLTVIIDRAVSGLVRDPSSSLSRTLSAGFGINRSTRSR